QREEMWQRVLEGTIERQHLPGHLLAPAPLVVVGLDVAVATDEFDDREVREGSSVRRASGVEHRRTLPRDTLELVEEPRLPDTGVSHDRDGASGAAECPRERLHERAELGLAPDEARQAARGAAFEPGPQRPDAEELIELDRFRY